MKIFNLQSRISKISWSIALAIVVNLIAIIYLPYGKNCWSADWSGQSCSGWPAAINGGYFNDGGVKALIIDLFFWVLIIYMILSLVKRFRKM